MFRNLSSLLRQRPGRFLSLAASLCFGAFFLGCAGGTIDTERLLAAAGFQMRMADSPERLAHLSTMTQRQLVPEMKDGSLRYVYADDKYCKCLYVGTEKAYQRYERFAFKQRIANQQQQAAMAAQEASLNWSSWGPWYSPWY